MEIEALLKKIEQLTPQFGRAQQDLVALVQRGRGSDFKGVLQNSRLVVEMLLRSMVTTELKQTPGKAMLDELLQKFRQQANAGIIPTNILAHMGTVQAWGNLSSHDHAGGLHEEGVRVGREELVTALNSMVAILSWYAERYPTSAKEASAPSPSPAAPPKKSKAPVTGGLVLLVGLLVAAGYFATQPASTAGHRLRLNAWYQSNREPLPAEACQTENPAALSAAAELLGEKVPEADRHAKAEEAIRTLQALGDTSAEANYFLARAHFLMDSSLQSALDNATGCPGFAAAENLAGNFAVKAKRLDAAAAHYVKAVELAPDFLNARFNHAMVQLRQSEVDKAVGMFKELLVRDPTYSDAHFFLGMAYEAKARAAAAAGQDQEAAQTTGLARSSYCKARDLGNELAKERCER